MIAVVVIILAVIVVIALSGSTTAAVSVPQTDNIPTQLNIPVYKNTAAPEDTLGYKVSESLGQVPGTLEPEPVKEVFGLVPRPTDENGTIVKPVSTYKEPIVATAPQTDSVPIPVLQAEPVVRTANVVKPERVMEALEPVSTFLPEPPTPIPPPQPVITSRRNIGFPMTAR